MRILLFLLLAMPGAAQLSFKGQELYSWKRDGHWNYALLVGTNRNKTWPEIERANLGDLDQLEKRLDQQPAGELIFWFHRCEGGAGQLSYPPAHVKARVLQACQQRKLELSSPR